MTLMRLRTDNRHNDPGEVTRPPLDRPSSIICPPHGISTNSRQRRGSVWVSLLEQDRRWREGV